MSRYLDKEQIERHASGKWEMIARELAPSLSVALERIGKHVPCPSPGHESPDGFRLFKDFSETGGGICSTCGSFNNGFSLLMWINGWDFRSTLEAVAEILGIEGGRSHQPRERNAKVGGIRKAATGTKTVDPEWLRNLLNKTWQDSIPLDSPKAVPALKYLRNRGLNVTAKQLGSIKSLRYHDNLYYKDKETGKVSYHPAIVAAIQDSAGKAVTLHRTYLTHDGKKAPVASPKTIMPYPEDDGRHIRGSAIRLGPVTDVVFVCEGIEKAFAIYERTGIYPLVTISATLFPNVDVPKSVRAVIAWGDKDVSGAGQRACKSLVDRLQTKGIKAIGIIPVAEIPVGKKSIDWLDVLNICGKEGIPTPQPKF